MDEQGFRNLHTTLLNSSEVQKLYQFHLLLSCLCTPFSALSLSSLSSISHSLLPPSFAALLYVSPSQSVLSLLSRTRTAVFSVWCSSQSSHVETSAQFKLPYHLCGLFSHRQGQRCSSQSSHVDTSAQFKRR
ncbi:hypothetical protein VIGAN_03083400 [Vigna angularis var. angularis]|uniref:Uncharacterized protein n=1 Tax=Vigna angularis var. angularis TaxID=157739 RepID=A0A0S3RKR1_PHAAN|nr:hypothetical protein VIGAN_03083400 [Vigna angularis var. angularis]